MASGGDPLLDDATDVYPEAPLLFKMGDELTHHDEDDYRITEFLGQGGSGEVYRIASSRHGPNRVAKVYLPFHYFQRLNAVLRTDRRPPEVSEQLFEQHEGLRISDREYSALAATNHPFIVRVHDLKQVVLSGAAVRRFATKFGLKDRERTLYAVIGSYAQGVRIDEFARSARRDEILEALHGVAEALDYLNFSAGILHCDVKSQNVIVDPRNHLPVLVDFGLAQKNASGETRLFNIPEQLRPPPPELPKKALEVVRKVEEANSLSNTEIWEAFAPWIDRYQYGRLLQALARDERAQLSKSEREFIKVLGNRLTNVTLLLDSADQGLAELVGRAYADKAYRLVRAGAGDTDVRLPSPSRPINIPEELRQLAMHPALVRLNRVNQLGLLPARFPGATHSRFLHSLDTYRITRSLLRRLVERPLFRAVMAPRDVTKLLVAALYHDVNHLPLLHVFQEFEQKEGWPDPYALGLAFPGDSVATDLTELLGDVGLDTTSLRALAKPEEARSLLGRQPTEAESFMSSVISSGCDVDKLSYLQLDSMFSGLGFAAALNLDRLFEAADVAVVNRQGRSVPVISFHQQHADAVEDVVRARWIGFRDLYWCDENRAMMAAVLDVVRAIVASAGGAAQLAELFAESVRLSDYALLSRVDALAQGLGINKMALTSFFDTMWVSVVPSGRIRDAGLAVALREAGPAARAAVDERFREEILHRANLPSDSSAVVAVDVPRRDLNLGGDIYLHDDSGSSRLADFRGIYVRHLEELAARVTVYMDRAVLSALREQDRHPEALAEIIRGVVDEQKEAPGWS